MTLLKLPVKRFCEYKHCLFRDIPLPAFKRSDMRFFHKNCYKQYSDQVMWFDCLPYEYQENHPNYIEDLTEINPLNIKFDQCIVCDRACMDRKNGYCAKHNNIDRWIKHG